MEIALAEYHLGPQDRVPYVKGCYMRPMILCLILPLFSHFFSGLVGLSSDWTIRTQSTCSRTDKRGLVRSCTREVVSCLSQMYYAI